jgi:hypothetical protein
MALINQNSIIGVTSITSPSASNVLTVHTNDTTERLRVSTSGVSFSGTNASLDTSGNISAVDGTFTGNVSVGGTLTYEDVTSVDSVGLSTFQNGIHVTGGSVGIGTDNPDSNSQLHIYNTSGNAKLTIETNETYDSYINFSGATSEASIGYEPTSNSLIFSNAADGLTTAERLRITSGGNIGIGTDNPVSGKLHVQDGNIRISGLSENILKIRNDNADYDVNISQTDDGSLRYRYGGDERIRVTTTGNIGIGTTNPGSKLAVHGSITESTDGVTYYPVVTQQDVGLNQNQIPLNQNLGGMAYMDTSNYEQVFEIPATDVTSYFKEGTENIYIGMEGHAPSSVAWPSGSLNQIDVWEIDFQLTYPNMTSGRNDLWMLIYYHNGSTITTANSVEWNNWVLARSTYAGTNTGWNQIQSSASSNWGKLANYMDAKLFSGQIRFYRGGTNDFTGSNAGQRTGVMWQFNYTHGGVGSTLAFGSGHPTTPSPSQPLAGFILNADPENAGTVDSNGNSQVFGGYIRQRGFRLQGNT